MPATLNFRAALPMLDQMNAIAQVSAAPSTGPKLDNRRVLAGVVDLLIVTAGALVVLYAGDSLTGGRQGALVAVILGWALYYYFALESGAGQTVGKKLMNLRVVRADGHPAGMREIAVRTILRVIDGIGVYIVGLIVMLVTGDRRQRLGDLAGGTIVVDASGSATAVAEPAAPAAEAEADDVAEAGELSSEEPVATAPDPTRTITLPSRPTPPETLSDLVEPELVEAEPVVESEPEPDVLEAEPLVETEPEAEPFEVKPFEVEPYDAEPIELESVVPVEPVVEAEEPVVEVDEAPEPAEEALPPAMSPSLEGLAADVAAAHDSGQDDEADEDEPVSVKSVETVSAMDLIMGAAEENAEKSEEDEGPVSA
ncbi:MAG: RDD family protein [Thermoleophilaceae bacterium]